MPSCMDYVDRDDLRQPAPTCDVHDTQAGRDDDWMVAQECKAEMERLTTWMEDHFPQANRRHERTVDVVIRLLQTIEPPQMAKKRDDVEAVRFMECDTCRAKPGMSPLCRGCLHNRQVIEVLRAHPWLVVDQAGSVQEPPPEVLLGTYY